MFTYFYFTLFFASLNEYCRSFLLWFMKLVRNYFKESMICWCSYFNYSSGISSSSPSLSDPPSLKLSLSWPEYSSSPSYSFSSSLLLWAFLALSSATILSISYFALPLSPWLSNSESFFSSLCFWDELTLRILVWKWVLWFCLWPLSEW